jgi:signal transduction histidine kinase
MSETYRAVVLPAFNAELVLEERAVPTELMGPDAQWLKVVAAGVCHSDLHVVEGRWPALPTPLVMGHEITVEAPDDLDVPVAARLFEVVVQNLVDNALIHGGDDAAVHISIARDGDEALLIVTDTGIGIPAQHLPFVFQRFYRGDASRTGPGSGLGLALVKHIVEAHGGTVAADSDGESGTTVRVTLPLLD